tara:strand:+ start:92 stop:295 length:204 start_codon:yes stop_codon:yes gene_type:complete
MAKKYVWKYNEQQVTIEEYIKKINELTENAINNLREMEGDMYLSDFRNLCTAQYKIDNLIKALNEDD